MAKRQRNHFEEPTYYFGNSRSDGVTPLPLFPYMHSQQRDNHPFMSSMNSFPVNQGYADDLNPARKRMREDRECSENEPHHKVPRFITLATEIAHAVVQRNDSGRTLAMLEKTKRLITSEKDKLECISNGSPIPAPSDKAPTMNEFSDADSLHWMNNFMFLQIGYLSSFGNRLADVRTNVAGGVGPWSCHSTSVLQGSVHVLLNLHQYNDLRHRAANANAADTYQFRVMRNRVVVQPFELTEIEIKECANVLCKLIRRTLSKIQYDVEKKDGDISGCMITLRDIVEILGLVQRSMLSSTLVLDSDEGTMNTLVHMVGDIAGNARLSKEGSIILDTTMTVLKVLSIKTNTFDANQPLSTLAFICADIIRSCSTQVVMEFSHVGIATGADENYACFIGRLENLRNSLRSRDKFVQQKWHLLFRSMELMLKNIHWNTHLVKAILTCVKYFSMSRHIVPFLSNDKQLIDSIALAVTNAKDTSKEHDHQTGFNLDAMECITVVASKLTSLSAGSGGNYASTSNGCTNLIGILINISKQKIGIRLQDEVMKTLRIFIGNCMREIHTSIGRLQRSHRREFLYWVIRIRANNKVSRSAKRAAITFLLELLFYQNIKVETELYADVMNACKKLMECKDSICEEHFVQIVTKRLTESDKVENLANDVSFLAAVITTVNNNKLDSHIRADAMHIINVVSCNVEISKKLARMKDFARCITRLLSFDGDGEECVLCRHHAIETLIQVASFPVCQRYLEVHKELLNNVSEFAYKMQSDYDEKIEKEKDINERNPPSATGEVQSTKSKLRKVAELLKPIENQEP